MLNMQIEKFVLLALQQNFNTHEYSVLIHVVINRYRRQNPIQHTKNHFYDQLQVCRRFLHISRSIH